MNKKKLNIGYVVGSFLSPRLSMKINIGFLTEPASRKKKSIIRGVFNVMERNRKKISETVASLFFVCFKLM